MSEIIQASNSNLDHIVAKCHWAKVNGYGALSTGEAIAAAMVLNRADWLRAMGYTMAQAVNRLDDEWLALLRRAERVVVEEN